MRNAAIAAFFLFPFSLRAQPELSLNEALKIGLDQNFGIKLARNEVDQALDGNTIGMAGFLPSLDLNLGGNMQSSNLSQRFASGLVVDRPGVGSTSINGGLALNWLFFDGGKMFLTRKKLGRQLTAAELQMENQVLFFADSVSAAYYQVVLAELDLKVLEQSIRSVEERLRLAGEQQRIGTRPASDALQARMDVIQLKNRILAQRKQIEIRKGALNLIIGREPDVDFQPSDSVVIPEPATFLDYKNRVLQKNPALRAQREGLEITRLEMGEIRSLMFPRINMNMALNYQRNSSTAGFALYNRNVGPFAGLNLSVPLFSGVPVRQQLRMARREITQAELQLKLTENRLLFQLWRNIKNLETWLESMENEQSTLLIARENLRILQDRFLVGAAGSLEVREAENQLENAKLRLQQFRFQARISGNALLRLSAELDSATGK
jgi:outer membrane protein